MIGADQSMPMFQDEDTYRINREMSSIGHLCSTIQGSAQYLSLMIPAIVLLPGWSNNCYPIPGLNVVINHYKLLLLPTSSIGKAFQYTISCRDSRVNVQSVKL